MKIVSHYFILWKMGVALAGLEAGRLVFGKAFCYICCMTDFAAIDFETANEWPSSVCSVGVVIVRNGEIVDRFYSLIHPEPEYYQWFCQRVHGLCEADTEDAPVFPKVWEKIIPMIEGLPLVAHNACFDERCLKEAFRVYRMDDPGYMFLDTLAASRRHFGPLLPNHQLQTVAFACGYHLTRHHHALADAEACAHIALRLLVESSGISDPGA